MDKKLSWKNYLSYGLGDLYGGGAFMITGLLYMYFLTDVAGLSPGLAGMAFAIGKGWDAVSDPLMGVISDRTKSKFGRRRVYFLAGIVPIIITFAMIWLRLPNLGQIGLLCYYSIAYVLFSTVITMVSVPYSALNADMTADYSERTKLTTIRMVFSQIAVLLGGTLPRLLVDSFGGEQGHGFLIMGFVFGVLFGLPYIVVFLGTFERPVTSAPDEIIDKSQYWQNFKDTAASIWRNKPFRYQVSMFVCAYTAIDVLMAVFLYFLKYVVLNDGLYTPAIGALICFQLSSLPLFMFIANKKGKGFAYRLGVTVFSVVLVAAFFILGKGSTLVFILPFAAIVGHGLSGAALIPWAMLPEVIQVDEYLSGKQRAGIYSGILTFMRKAVQGLFAMPLLGFALEFSGFIPNMPQNMSAQTAITIMFSLVPALFGIAGILLSFKYSITPVNYEYLKKAVEDPGSLTEEDEQKLNNIIS